VIVGFCLFRALDHQRRVLQLSSLLYLSKNRESTSYHYGSVAYRLQLPPQLAAIHDVFHVSQLRKCIKTPTEIIDSQAIEIKSDLSYTEHPIRIPDTKERSTRRETVRMFKIKWNHHTEEEATWETESYLQRNFPGFLRANPHI
jgi:hypothetical protein